MARCCLHGHRRRRLGGRRRYPPDRIANAAPRSEGERAMRRKPRGSPPREGELGFTLVELLVALTLFSLLSLALFGSVRAGTQAWAGVTAHADRNDNSIHAHDLLRHMIEDAYPLFLSDDPTHGHVDFDGSSSSLSFLTNAPIALRSAGRSRVALSVQQHQGTVDLMIASHPELAQGSAAGDARKPLLEGAASIEIGR